MRAVCQRVTRAQVSVSGSVACQGNRPSRLGVPLARGVFGAAMQVELVNDGPVTVVLDV